MIKQLSKVGWLLLFMLVITCTVQHVGRTKKLIDLTKSEGGIVVTVTNTPRWLPQSVVTSRWFARLQDAGWFCQATQVHLHSANAKVTPIVELMANIPGLQGAFFDYSRVRHHDLKCLARCQGLEQIGVAGTCFSLSDIEEFTKLPKLKFLRCSDTGISDSAIPSLLKLQRLGEINISQTSISEQGLEDLVKHPHIEFIDARHLQMSRESVQRIEDSELVFVAAAPADSVFVFHSRPYGEAALSMTNGLAMKRQLLYHDDFVPFRTPRYADNPFAAHR